MADMDETYPLCSVHSPPFLPQWSSLASFPPPGRCEGSYSSAMPGNTHAPCSSCLKQQGELDQKDVKCCD